MSQRHLYGGNPVTGLGYTELNPPVEWMETTVQATINDDSFEANISTNEFTWVGEVAEYIKDTWIPQYGVFVGVPYRIEVTEDGSTEVVFDGMINLRDREIMSKERPIIFKAPVIEFQNNATIFDKISIMTQGMLFDQGFISISDAVDIPTVKESKKNVAERAIILGQFGGRVVSAFTRWIQDFLSAISDTVGVSLPLGLIETLLLFVNIVLELQLLIDQFQEIRNLFFPDVRYYKGIKLRTIIEKALIKAGNYPVDWGIIEPILDKIVLMPSQDGFDGWPTPGVPMSGILNRRDWGYLVLEAQQTVQLLFNTRQDVRNNVAHIKTKSDPFWTNSPLFTPEDTKLETTAQYQNGTFKERTDEVFGTTYISYEYDPTDTHTLTQNEDDAHEIHRRPINLPDERLNLMRGLQEIKIPYALCVRKQPLDNLLDLFMGVNAEFDFWLTQLQDKISALSDSISSDAGAGSFIDTILSSTGLNTIIEGRTGVLKIDDNAFGLPKLVYLNDEGKIPENFKDFVGAAAIYNNWYLPESPADVNEFAGQKVDRKSWRIKFGLVPWQQTRTNPYFDIPSGSGKFTTITWKMDQGSAVTDAEQDEVFDTNITEDVI